MEKAKFRHFYTSSGKLVEYGKSAEQNEKLVASLLKERKDEIVLHTKAPGSPFCVIRGKASAKDTRETAVVCASFSQQWKQGKKKAEVHIFRTEQIAKEKRSAVGSFTVLGKIQKISVELELWLGIQKGELRAAPRSCFEKTFVKMVPGKMSKDKAIAEIKKKLDEEGLDIKEDEIASAIPAGGFKLC